MVEEATAPDPSGAVVLDIGGDVGAAVLLAPAALAAEEIEYRAAGARWDGRHVAVHRRELPGGPVWAAVVPGLRAGRWEARLRGDNDAPVVGLEITGGAVVRVAYPPTPGGGRRPPD